MGALIDLTGQKFGRLTVLKRDKTVSPTKGAFWVCECQCGTVKTIDGCALRGGLTLSCGCYNKEINSGPKDLSYMVGKKFGKLTVIKRGETHITKGGQRKVTWVCKCQCGNQITVRSQDLKNGHTKSCGCLPTSKRGKGLIDLTGKVFGKLTVISRSPNDYRYKIANGKTTTSPLWICQCDCGNKVIVQGGNLRRGYTTNCGCEKRISKGEEVVEKFLNEHNIKHRRECTFDDLKTVKDKYLRFDFGILDDRENLIVLVEYQGEQHYIPHGTFGLYQKNYFDKVKKEYCVKNNIILFEIKYNDDIKSVLNNLLNEIEKLSA